MKRFLILFLLTLTTIHGVPRKKSVIVAEPVILDETTQQAFRDYIARGKQATKLEFGVVYQDMHNDIEMVYGDFLQNLRFQKQFRCSFKWLDLLKKTPSYDETLRKAMGETFFYNPYVADSKENKQLADDAWAHFDECANQCIMEHISKMIKNAEPIVCVNLYRTAVIAKFLLIHEHKQTLKRNAIGS